MRALRQQPDAIGELRAMVAALEARVEVLESANAADLPVSDLELRREIARATVGHRFTAGMLLNHTRVAPGLALAFDRALVELTTAGIGCWLRSNRGVHDGVSVTRRGKYWLVVAVGDMGDITSPVVRGGKLAT